MPAVYEFDDQGYRIIGYNQGIEFYDPDRELQCAIYLGDDNQLYVCGAPFGAGGGEIDYGALNARYLRLDCSNDPLTASLDVQGNVDLIVAGAQYQIEGDHALSLEDLDGERTNVRVGVVATAVADSDESVIIGDQAGGSGGVNVEDSVVIGRYAANQSSYSTLNAVVIGNYACEGGSPGYSTIIGDHCGQDSIFYEAVAIGRQCAENINFVQRSVVIGDGAFEQYSGNYDVESSVVIGTSAGGDISKDLDFSVIIGEDALNTGVEQTVSAVSAVVIGQTAGYEADLEYTIAVGARSAHSANSDYSVFLGYRAGEDLAVDYRLIIESSDEIASPLIYGEFDNDLVILYADTANTNVTHRVLKLAQVTSGTAAADFGVGLAFRLEDAGGNEEDAAAIDAVWTTPTDTSEDADLVFSAIAGGSLAERARLRSSGQFAADALTVTDGISAPSAVTGEAVIYVDTADGDLKVKFADGFVATIAADS